MAKSSVHRLYLIPVLSKALDVLELLQKHERPMSLETIYKRTHIPKTTVYRILKTFIHRGYIAQSQDGLYRVVTRPRKVRFGFGKECAGPMVLDNRYEAASYGPRLIQIGLSILRGLTIPPYNFVEHKLVRADALRAEALQAVP